VSQAGLNVLAALSASLGPDRYALWFGPSVSVSVEGDRVIISATGAFLLERLRRGLRDEIQTACRQALGATGELEFRLVSAADLAVAPANPDPASADKPAPEDKPASVDVPVARAAANRAPAPHRGPRPVAKVPAATVPVASARPNVPAPRTVTSASPGPAARPGHPSTVASAAGEKSSVARRKFAVLESFVVGPGNRLAFTSAQMVVERPGHLNPLLVWGPAGVGKTHLLEGILAGLRRSQRMARALYLTAEQFTSDFVESVRGGLPSFRRKYRTLDLLLLDDVQFFQGKKATLVELWHTLDVLVREGRQVVLAADRPPQDLAELGPELLTRLSAGMSCAVEPPDFETRLGILHELARGLELRLPLEVVRFIAEQFCTQARELAGALHRLQAVSRAEERPITLALAEQALCDLIRHEVRAVQMPEIEQAVCELFGVDTAALRSAKRAKHIAQPRMLAMWLARHWTRAAYTEIGDFFDRRHSTVIAAHKKVETWRESTDTLAFGGRQLSAGDAIRLVEKKLKRA